jgi:hypothetical protein
MWIEGRGFSLSGSATLPSGIVLSIMRLISIVDKKSVT